MNLVNTSVHIAERPLVLQDNLEVIRSTAKNIRLRNNTTKHTNALEKLTQKDVFLDRLNHTRLDTPILLKQGRRYPRNGLSRLGMNT